MQKPGRAAWHRHAGSSGAGGSRARASMPPSRSACSTSTTPFGAPEGERRTVPQVAEIDLRPPRISPPASLAAICTSEPYERLLHSYGKSFPEAVRIFERDFRNAPDVVARPRSEADVVAVLDWAADADAAVIPFGGGSSVVGGVEPAVGDSFAGTISLDLEGPRPAARGRSASAARRACRAACSGPRSRRRSSRMADAAPLPAELRVLDARRLDRDPLGRPLRDALHPHRGFSREHARDHAGGRDRDPAPAGLRRRARAPTGCSSAPRARSA